MKWISVNDSLPDFGIRVLCWVAQGYAKILERWDIKVGDLYDYQWTDWSTPEFDPDEVTHWMELPEGPK